MMNKERHSIVLIPTGEVFNELQKIINDLSDKFSSPKFVPHVTLLAGIKGDRNEILAKAEELAKEIKPFKIEFTTLSYLDERHRCLFFDAKSTPEYEEVIQKATKKFEGNFNPKYVRHLSILYSDFPEKTKLEIIKNIKLSWRSFIVDKIHVQFTTGNEVWEEIARFPL